MLAAPSMADAPPVPWRSGDAATESLHDARFEELGRQMATRVGAGAESGDVATVVVGAWRHLAADVADAAAAGRRVLIVECAETDTTDGDGDDGEAAAAAVRAFPGAVVGVLGGLGSSAAARALSDACDVRVGFGRAWGPPGECAQHKATLPEARAAASAWARALADRPRTAPPAAELPPPPPPPPETPLGDNVPRVLWTYWADGSTIPGLVRACVARFQRLNPRWRVVAVTDASLPGLLRGAPLPPAFPRMAAAARSDWVRLFLVAHYGGVWLDASVVLLSSLDRLVQGRAEHFVGYYMAGWNSRPDARVVESWFLAAPKGSPFVAEWFREFDRFARFHSADADAYLAAVRPSLDLAKFPPQFMAYLAIHIAAQVVLQKGGERRFKLHLRKAQDGPFFVQSKLCSWNDALLADYLVTETNWPPSPLIKLTGKMRAALEARLGDAAHPPVPASLIGALLAGDTPTREN